MSKINIKGLEKWEVFKALYDNAQPLGMGWLQFVPGNISEEEAKQAVEQYIYFDYYRGRVMKVDITGDELDTARYDYDNGTGAAEQALQPLFDATAKKKKAPNFWQRCREWLRKWL